jgi:hypothetical protein
MSENAQDFTHAPPFAADRSRAERPALEHKLREEG